jgi:hypothetical protein
MNEQDKLLLLEDLCARLPYGVKCKIEKDWFYDEIKPYDSIFNPIILERLLSQKDTDYCVKPYLRQMPNMTEKEMSELRQWGCLCMTPDGCVEDIGVYGAIHSIPVIDWLNAHHFDYRGLIEKGLALAAPEGMYN